jgi:Protein of unknown function (DUF2442)
MTKHNVITTDAEIDAAIERAGTLHQGPLARIVKHLPGDNLLIVELNNRRRLAIPIEDVQGLGEATPEQLKNYELLGEGSGISFPDLDVDLSVPALMEGVYGNRRWMARLGKKGGQAKTEAKRLASRANGSKGGRPKVSAFRAT